MNIGSIKRLRIAGLHPTRRFSTGFGLLAALLLVFGMIGPSLAWGAASTTSVPGGYERWLGALEGRSEEHTSELQSLMRISYAVFCLKKKNKNQNTSHTQIRYTASSSH